MKEKLTKITFITYLLLTNFILFAKDDGGDILDDGIIGNPAEPTNTPVDNQIVWLFLLGLAFAYHLYKTKKVKA
ncbi:MAG: hypothetical protein RL699_1663 [Bacteroidota bacterium]|jgi:hypothetical protein